MSVWLKIVGALAAAQGLAVVRSSTCKVCGRPLTNEVSIERGMGSCCAKKAAAKDTRTIDMFEAGTPGSEGYSQP